METLALSLAGLVTLATVSGAFWRLGWPFDFTPHLRPQLLALSLVAAVLCLATGHLGLALAAIGAALLNAQPYVTFARFERPMGADEGVSVAWRDAGRRRAGMARLADHADADVLVVCRPPRMTVAQVRAQFPDHPYLAMSAPNDTANDTGEAASTEPDAPAARLVVVSRLALTSPRTYWPVHRSRDRCVMTIDVATSPRPLTLVVVDTPAPLTPARARARDALLDLAAERAPAHGRYLLMGAFNASPWSGVFRHVPGRRAGDPRARATWGSAFPLLGLTRDHVMIGASVRLQAFVNTAFAAGGHTTSRVRVTIAAE